MEKGRALQRDSLLAFQKGCHGGVYTRIEGGREASRKDVEKSTFSRNNYRNGSSCVMRGIYSWQFL